MRTDLLWIATLTAVLGAVPAPAQTPDEPEVVYRREVFRYSRAGRPDPFRSLLRNTELGVRLEDLSVRGIVYSADPARSVAVLVRAGSERPLRARVGDRIGGVRIVGIRPRRVEVVVEEFGVARRGTLELKAAPKKGEST